MPQNLYPQPAASERARRAAVARAENAELRVRAMHALRREDPRRMPSEAAIRDRIAALRNV